MKPIKVKIATWIIVPIIISFVVYGIIIALQIGNKFIKMQVSETELKSETASYQVSEFFTKYCEVVHQMEANELLLQMMREIKTPGSSKDAPSYEAAAACLDKILATDENIALAWTVDMDSGESVRSGGVIRGLASDYDVTTRGWYIEAVEAMKMIITEPYLDTLSQTMVTSIISPAYDDNGELLGLMAIDLTLDTVNSMMESYSLGETGFFVLATETGTIIHHPNPEVESLSFAEAALSENVTNAMLNGQAGEYRYKYNGDNIRGFVSVVGDTGWTVLSGLPSNEFYRSWVLIIITIVVITVIVIVILTILLAKISSSIVRPIQRLTKEAEEIAAGNLAVEVDVSSNDETGQVAAALQRAVIRLQDYTKYIDEIAQTLNQIADGNLKFTLTQAYEGEFEKVKKAFDVFSAKFNDILHQMNRVSGEVMDSSGEMEAQSQMLAQGAQQQTEGVQALSSSFHLMREQMLKSSEYVDKVSVVIEREADSIQNSKVKMEELVDSIHQISSKSDEIRKIIGTIDEIARQTNMLSLNASIEAARAGDAGKGFAVVANQVSNLAQESTAASKNIAQLIEETLSIVAESVILATESKEIQESIASEAMKNGSMMKEVAEYTRNQTKESQGILNDIDTIRNVVETNSAAAEEGSATSEELSNQAKYLQNLVSNFRLM